MQAEIHNNESAPTGALPILKLSKISKRFPGALALDNVDFTLCSGETHVLFGENGAGKSTLINIITGALKPTQGKMTLDGKTVSLDSVHHAQKKGIAAVFQEFSLISQMTVAENICLGEESNNSYLGVINDRAIHREAKKLLENLGFDISPNRIVGTLSRAEQQMVEIAKAFRSQPKVLILDEPTASLTNQDAQKLFSLIDNLKSQGTGIIYITHRMSEVYKLGDRITVLRDGKFIRTIDIADANEAILIKLMTGRDIKKIFPTISYNPSETILEIDGLTTSSGSVTDASFFCRAGEVVGVAGVIGSGKSELLRACFGIEKARFGNIYVDGKDKTNLTTRNMIESGIFYVTSDRKEEGLLLLQSVKDNIMLPVLDNYSNNPGHLIRKKSESEAASRIAHDMDVQPLDIYRNVGNLSGGNQQKVLLGRSTTTSSRCFIFDEPTVGVDVGARASIYNFIKKLCESGTSVVIISSDLSEITQLCHRAYVMHKGRIKKVLEGDEITEENVVSHFIESEE
mgnify:CR=1 FL=1